MEKENIKEKSDFEIKHAFTFGTAQLSDVITYQTFTFWIFTFYFTIVKLNVNFITIAFIIWSIWNSLNDPLLGQISDRTHTKWGRRKPWIMIALGPLSFIMQKKELKFKIFFYF
ncbi:MAG: MFS transporter [Promethearchaeia archaeon]